MSDAGLSPLVELMSDAGVHDSFVKLCARTEGHFNQAGRLPVDPRCSADPYFPYDDGGYDEAWSEKDDWKEFDGMEDAFDGVWNEQESPEEPAVDPATSAPQTPLDIPMPGYTDTDDEPPGDTESETDADAPKAPQIPWKAPQIPWKAPASTFMGFPTPPPMAKVKAKAVAKAKADAPWRTAPPPPPPPALTSTSSTQHIPATSKWLPAQAAHSSLGAAPKQTHAIGAAPPIAGKPATIVPPIGAKVPRSWAPETPPPPPVHPRSRATSEGTSAAKADPAGAHFFEDGFAQLKQRSQEASSSSGESLVHGQQLILQAAEKDPVVRNALLKQYYEAEAKASQIGKVLKVSWREAGPRPEYGPMPATWKGATWRPNAQRWATRRGVPEKQQEL